MFLSQSTSIAQDSGIPVTFSKDKIYKMEGDYIAGNNLEFFVINRGTGNEQRIKLLPNKNHQMFTKGKYQLCFKIKADCFLECEASIIGKENLLPPYHELKTYSPSTENGKHPDVKENVCN